MLTYLLYLCNLQYDELESSLRDNSVLAQVQKTEHLQVRDRKREIRKFSYYLEYKNTLSH